MARKGGSFQRIRGDFNTGINITGSPVMVPENTLTELENGHIDLSGIVQKRPKFKQHGQGFYYPTPVDPEADPAETLSYMSKANDPTLTVIAYPESAGARIRQLRNGPFRMQAYESTTAITAISQLGVPAGQSKGSRGEVTFIMTFKSPDLSLGGDPHIGRGLSFYFSPNALYDRMFVLTSTSLWTYGPTGEVTERPLGVTIDDGKAHSLIITISDADTAYVYIDDVEATSFQWDTYWDAGGLFSDAVIGLVASNANMSGTDYNTMTIANIIIRDVSKDAYTQPAVADISTFDELIENTFEAKRRLLALCGTSVWIDRDYEGMWNNLGDVVYPSGAFVKFRGEVYLINKSPSAKTTLFYKVEETGLQRIPSAPNIRFAVEHDGRIFGGGDYEHPGRLYFSGDRNANIWMDDDPLDAGFIDISLKDGEHLTAIQPFLGDLMVFTTTDTYRISGWGGVTEYERRLFKEGIGCYNQNSSSAVGNDIWVCGEDGISSITTSDQYGDMLYAKVSANVQGLFGNIGKHKQDITERFPELIGLSYRANNGMTYFSYASKKDDNVAGSLYACTADGKRWVGPWGIDHTCARETAIGFPYERTLMLGTADGKVLYDSFNEDPDATLTLKSCHIDGRSIDPSVVTMKKNWSKFRLLHNPHGNWDATITWRVDNDPWKTRTISLLPDDAQAITGSDWEVGDSVIVSKDTLAVTEFPLDCVGRDLQWQIEFSGAKFGGVGWEIDLGISGNEVD